MHKKVPIARNEGQTNVRDSRQTRQCVACETMEGIIHNRIVQGMDVELCDDPVQCRMRAQKKGIWKRYENVP